MMLFLKKTNGSYFYPFSVTFFPHLLIRNFPAYSGSTLRSRALPEYLKMLTVANPITTAVTAIPELNVWASKRGGIA